MRLTGRRRAAIAILLSWPLGFFYLYWAFYIVLNIGREIRGGYSVCSNDWRDLSATCGGGYDVVLAGAELLIVTAFVVLVAWALARWVMWPVRAMAETLGQLGPTNMGTRLRVAGPSDEVHRLADSIDAMLDRVGDGYEAQRRFAANASHELRTPLATQRALIEISLAGALSTEQLELVSRQLLATNQRNEALIEGLLVLAETERGLMTSSPQQLDRLVAELLPAFEASAVEKGLVLSSELARTRVSGEAPLLERLVSNLVGNAIKYNELQGWVRVQVLESRRLVVSNSGPMVPADQVNGLFEPFRRLSGDRLDHGGGAGLGLTIARSVVAAHGGTIAATANPGGGLTVEVQLPG
jgi:signal transduction histidine kinase